MIKQAVAHPKTATTAAVISLGSFALAGFGILGGLSYPGEGIAQFFGMLKTLGILGFILALVFLAIRSGFIKMMMVSENTSAAVARRSRLVRDKQTGRPVILREGSNRWYIALYRQLVLVHHGERFTQLGPRVFTFEGVTRTADFTMKWHIGREPESIELALTKVADRNWWNGEFNQLHEAIMEKSVGLLSSVLNEASLKWQDGQLVLDATSSKNRALFNKEFGQYGSGYDELIMSPVFPTEGQLGKDGNELIANAIRSTPFWKKPLRRNWRSF